VEAGDQTHSGPDKNAAHEQRTQDSPEQNAMLLLFRDREIIEDYEEDEEIIDAQGKFKNIPSDEFQRGMVALPEVQQDREGSGQRNVYGAPAQRLARTDDAAGTVDAQIHHQHAQREKVEQNPEVEQWLFLAALAIVDC